MPDAFHFDVIKFMHVNLMCYWVSPISELLLPYSITQPLRIWCAPINLIELYQYVFNNITKTNQVLDMVKEILPFGTLISSES